MIKLLKQVKHATLLRTGEIGEHDKKTTIAEKTAETTTAA